MLSLLYYPVFKIVRLNFSGLCFSSQILISQAGLLQSTLLHVIYSLNAFMNYKNQVAPSLSIKTPLLKFGL
jgi:hypothetical protein